MNTRNLLTVTIAMAVRTNEFSGKYDCALADESEIRHLLNRRQLVLDRRSNIIRRARTRFEAYLATTPGNIGNMVSTDALLELCLVPRFPAKQVCRQEELSKLVRRVHYPNYRGVGFPRLQMGIMTQHESAIIREPLTDVSFFETNIWGMAFYVTRLDEKEYTKHLAGIHVHSFVAHLLLFLRHADDLFAQMGLTGPILVEASLQAIRERKWVYAKSIAEGVAPVGATKQISGLDSAFSLSVSTTVEKLREKRDEVAIGLVRTIFFSLDWNDLVDNQAKVDRLIGLAHQINAD